MTWTRQRLLEIKAQHGINGLRQVAKPLGIKDTSMDRMMDKILEHQELRPMPEPQQSPFHTSQMAGVVEFPVSRCKNPDDCDRWDEVGESAEKFAAQWGFALQFVPRMNAFRCYKGDKHVDWISINELNRRYGLGIEPMIGHEREYQPPEKRAYA